MSEETKARLDTAVKLVDDRFGEGAAGKNPQLIASVIQSLTLDSHAIEKNAPPETPVSWSRLILGISVFLWWLVLIVAGYQVDSSGARRLLGKAGNLIQPVEARTNDESSAAPTNTVREAQMIIKSYIDGKEVSSLTNVISKELSPSAVAGASPLITPKNIFLALLIALFCWTWPNLVFLAAAASAFGSILVKASQSNDQLRNEIAWSMVNGFFVVVFLGCSQIFLGDTVYKTLGVTEALQIQIKQDRFLSLAFFASLIGLLLGVAQRRLTSLPGNLPLIGFLFKAK